jgi:hypothetical protein
MQMKVVNSLLFHKEIKKLILGKKNTHAKKNWAYKKMMCTVIQCRQLHLGNQFKCHPNLNYANDI